MWRVQRPANGPEALWDYRHTTGGGSASIEESPESVSVVYAPDGHRSTFARSWLIGNAPDGSSVTDIRSEDAKQLWLAADLAGGLPEEIWTAYLEDPRRRAACLEAVVRLGFVILHDMPCEFGPCSRLRQASATFARPITAACSMYASSQTPTTWRSPD